MNETQKSTKKALIIYSICIFTCAVALILLVWFMQEKNANEVAMFQSQAITNKNQLDAIGTENARLKNNANELVKENETLTAEVETLTSANETLAKQLEAEKKLVELLSLKAKKKNSELKEKAADFEEAGYSQFLSAESLEKYNSIIK